MSDNETKDHPKEALPGPDEEVRTEPDRTTSVRKFVLLGTLAIVVALWGVLRHQQANLEAQAAPLVEKVLLENKEPDVEAVSKLTVSREALFFGTPHAKVEVFVRASSDTQGAGIRGIEYDYALENGDWVFKDSGSCSSKECAIRGREAFAKQ